ncbi:MAG: glycerol-3-phosphate responsive antiterminator [Synergistetes bacterium]|nr:glycerol-3-phosphate responsive antiterminator [Synergistota bacterium]
MRVINPLLKGVIASLWDFIDPTMIPVKTVFILNSSLCKLPEEVKACKEAGKDVYVDMDFIDGLSDGKAAVEYLKAIGVDGIISVKLCNFHYARKVKVPFILRIFALDSKAVEKAYNQVKTNGVEIVEILPGCSALKVGRLFKALGINVITGGLVSTKAELKKLLKVVDAVSTSSKNLWRNDNF